MEVHAVPAHRSAKPAKSADQPQPSGVRQNAGSKSSGKPRSASSGAGFESAKSRYGTAAWNRRQYHACRSGVVLESRKYGSPIVAPSRSRMLAIGCASSPRGFQPFEARIGRETSETASKPL